MTSLSTSLLPDHARWPARKNPPSRHRVRAAARKNWFVRMAQRYGFVPALESKPSARAELVRLLTTYVWWQGHEWPAYETRAQTSNYINRMPWEVLSERGHGPEQMPRYSVTLPDGSMLDVLVLARGREAAEGLLRAGLPEGSAFAKSETACELLRGRQDASGRSDAHAGEDTKAKAHRATRPEQTERKEISDDV